MNISLSCTSRVLFIGDSITDCGQREDVERLGGGYPRLIRDWLRAKNPASAPEVLNRGISGNKITDLAARWNEDVIDLAPDLLSIKIGINDVWHGLGGKNNGVEINQFREVYAELLQDVRSSLPHCVILLCEPSVIWPPQPEKGNAILQPYVAAVRDIGKEFSVQAVVPLHEAFEKARAARPDIAWAPDGVHPSSSGHALIARSWLEASGLL